MKIRNAEDTVGSNVTRQAFYESGVRGKGLSPCIQRASFETFGNKTGVSSRKSYVQCVSLASSVKPSDIREVLIEQGIAIDPKSRVSGGFNGASGQKNDSELIEISHNAEEIACLKTGLWAEEKLSGGFKVVKETGFRSEHTHNVQFDEETFQITPKERPSFNGEVNSGVEQNDSYASTVQNSKNAVYKISYDIVAHWPHESRDALQEAIAVCIQEKYEGFYAEATAEVEQQNVLSNAVAVLAAHGYMDFKDATAIAQDQQVEHGAQLAEISVTARDKERLKLCAIHDPDQAEKVDTAVVFRAPVAFIQGLNEEYHLMEHENGSHGFHQTTAVSVPLEAADSLQAIISDVVRRGTIRSMTGAGQWEDSYACLYVEGSVLDVSEKLAEAGLLPESVVSELKQKTAEAVAQFDGGKAEPEAPAGMAP